MKTSFYTSVYEFVMSLPITLFVIFFVTAFCIAVFKSWMKFPKSFLPKGFTQPRWVIKRLALVESVYYVLKLLTLSCLFVFCVSIGHLFCSYFITLIMEPTYGFMDYVVKESDMSFNVKFFVVMCSYSVSIIVFFLEAAWYTVLFGIFLTKSLRLFKYSIYISKTKLLTK